MSHGQGGCSCIHSSCQSSLDSTPALLLSSLLPSFLCCSEADECSWCFNTFRGSRGGPGALFYSVLTSQRCSRLLARPPANVLALNVRGGKWCVWGSTVCADAKRALHRHMEKVCKWSGPNNRPLQWKIHPHHCCLTRGIACSCTCLLET